MTGAKNNTAARRGLAVRKRRLSRPVTIVLAAGRSFFQAAVTSMLESQPDFRILGQAEDWRQAVDLVRRHQPEVLILEPWPPHLEAARVLGKLRSAGPATRTIILLEFDDAQEAAATRALGVDGVLWKGAVVDDLSLLVRNVSGKAGSGARCAAGNGAGIIPWASQLSKREREIAGLVIAGEKNSEIGEKLFISEQTVKNHVHHILGKLKIKDRLELILWATELASRASPDE